MTTSAPHASSAPPEEQFWQKYSPHHEFSLSSAGSIAVHIGMFLLIALALWLLSSITFDEKTPVPMRAAIVANNGDDAVNNPGQPGGNNQVDPVEIRKAVEDFDGSLPTIPDPQLGPRVEELPNLITWAKLPDEIRKALAGGKKGD